MITLDTGVLIALFDPSDTDHTDADALMRTHIAEGKTLGPLTLAEVLVRAASAGVEDRMSADIRSLGVTVTPLPDDAGVRLARLRATTGSKLPDCCVLLTALQTGSRIATFDEHVRRCAQHLSIGVVPA